MMRFHRLFSIATFQESTIQEMWISNVGGGRWRFSWRRQLFVLEVNLLDELLGVLEDFELGEVEDEWRWKLEKDDIFTVKSMSLKLEGRGLAEVVCPEGERRVFRQIWKIGASSKVRDFVWKALLDRIPTRVNLGI